MSFFLDRSKKSSRREGVKFVCLSQITLHLDRRTICQKVNNFSIVNRNYHIYVVRCSSTKSILHVGASAAAVKLSPASQE